MNNEKDLLELLKAKDTEAFSILYDKYAAALYGVIQKNIKDKKDGEVLLLDVFMDFKKKLKQQEFIEEGLFIILYRITFKILMEESNS